jgi:hypothetical protein
MIFKRDLPSGWAAVQGLFLGQAPGATRVFIFSTKNAKGIINVSFGSPRATLQPGF